MLVRSLLVCSALLLPGSAALAEVADEAAIEAIATPIMYRTRTPGVAVGVSGGGGAGNLAVVTRGRRDADVEFGPTNAVQRRDPFRIGSISKLFVGRATLLLVDQGKLRLEDKISRYVDGVPNGDEITLRMLGNHTSGLDDLIRHRWFQREILAQPDRDWTTRDLVRAGSRLDPSSEPGRGYRYSNLNTILLAAAIERVTGLSRRDAIQKLVLDPLNLHQTGFAPGALPSSSMHGFRHCPPDRWIGFGNRFTDVTFAGPGWTGAAGDMYSTVDDLLAAAKPLLTGEGLSASSREELHRWTETPGKSEQYGFQIKRRGPWLGHGGDVPGFNAAVWHHPQRGVTVAVLANLSNGPDGTAPASAIADKVREALVASDPATKHVADKQVADNEPLTP